MPEHVQDWALEFSEWLAPLWNEFLALFISPGVLSRHKFEVFLQEYNFPADERTIYERLDPENIGHVALRTMLQFRNSVRMSHVQMVSVADFKSLLKNVYQSVFKAFRAMDPQNVGYITRADYCKECHALGFQGSKSVWNELSKDGNIIELRGIDPQAAHTFTGFARQIFAKHRTLLECWKWTINSLNSSRIGMSEFVHAVSSLNIDESTGKFLFECLQENGAVLEETFLNVMRNWDEGGIYSVRVNDKFRSDRFDLVSVLTPATEATERQFVTWAESRWERIEMLFNRSADVTRIQLEEHLRTLRYPYDEKAAGSLFAGEGQSGISLRKYQRFRNQMKQSGDVAVSSKNDFYALIRRRYRSLASCWREYLDPMNEGKIAFRPFCKHCRDLGFKGDVKLLWNSLSAKSGAPGFITLRSIDEVTFDELTLFAAMIFEEHRNLNDVWRWSLNAGKGTTILLDTFQKYCSAHHFKGNAKQVFHALDLRSKNFISRKCFDLLLHWDPSILTALHRGVRAKRGVPKSGTSLVISDRDSPSLPEDDGAADELFGFQVILSPVEYAELLRKKAHAHATDGSSFVPKVVHPIGLGHGHNENRLGTSLQDLLTLA